MDEIYFTCDHCGEETTVLFDTVEYPQRHLCPTCFLAYAGELLSLEAALASQEEAMKAEIGDQRTDIKDCLAPYLAWSGESLEAAGRRAYYVAQGESKTEIKLSNRDYNKMLARANAAEQAVLHKYLAPHLKVTAGRAAYIGIQPVKE